MASLSQDLSGAASGAAAGSAAGPWGAAIGGAVGLGLSAFGPDAGAAAEQAAREQREQATKWLGDIDASQGRAEALTMTPQQMAAHGQALQSQESSVSRQETLAQSLNPAMVTAGKQLNDLLQGKSAPVMQNLNNQRLLQRQQLVDQLNSQGISSSSSAGMKQLQSFDAQTANMQTQTQQSYINQIKDIPVEGNNLNTAIVQSGNVLNATSQASPEAQREKVIQDFTSLKQAPEQALLNTAGGGAAAQGIQAQQNATMVGSLAQAAPSVIGAFKSPTAPSPITSPGTSPGAPSLGSSFSYNASFDPTTQVAAGQRFAHGGSVGNSLMANGGYIPGKPPAGRKDTLENDVVSLTTAQGKKIKASPQEFIIPISHTGSKKKMKEFVEKNFDKKGKAKGNYDLGSWVQGLTQSPGEKAAADARAAAGQPNQAPQVTNQGTARPLTDDQKNMLKGMGKAAGY